MSSRADDADPVHADLVYVPSSALPDPSTYTDLGDVMVDGERFAVRRRDHDGAVLYDWMTGPNDNYGFVEFVGQRPISFAQHRASIRDFLTGVDPETGYLSER